VWLTRISEHVRPHGRRRADSLGVTDLTCAAVVAFDIIAQLPQPHARAKRDRSYRRDQVILITRCVRARLLALRARCHCALKAQLEQHPAPALCTPDSGAPIC
jgi:hypothetical protein